MALTRFQKKYLKKNLRRLSLAEIAADLDLSENEILNFLKSRWRKEKYQKFLAQHRHRQNKPDKKTPGVSLPMPEVEIKVWLKQNWKILAFLALLVFAVYFNSLGNDFVSDDISRDGISGIRDSIEIDKTSYFWKPPYLANFNLKSVIIFFIHKLFGLNPIFYRLSNILSHLGATLVAYLLIKLFFNSPIPFISASIFAVHPILIESVAWISGGVHSNGSFLVLLSFLTYIFAIKGGGLKLYLLSIASFILSLSFNNKLIIFPIILLLYEFCFGEVKTNWKKLAPFWMVGGMWAWQLFKLLAPRTTALQNISYQEPGVNNPLIQVPVAITSYLELIFWSKNLTFYHSEVIFSQGEYFLRLGVFILFLATIVYFFKKDKRIFFWLSFFLITLAPTLTPLKIAWIVAERYVYLGSLGIFVVIATAIQKLGEMAKNQKISYVILSIALIALATRTIARNADWKNQDTLWLATAKVSPSSYQNHNNLGDLYARRGDLGKAVEEFQTAIRLKPNYGDAYHNLAHTYQQMGREDLAAENYQKALSFNPNLWQSHQSLAFIYFNQGKFDLAQEELVKAININPQNTNLHTNLGTIYLKLNDPQKAKEEFQIALQFDPDNEKAQEMLLSL